MAATKYTSHTWAMDEFPWYAYAGPNSVSPHGGNPWLPPGLFFPISIAMNKEMKQLYGVLSLFSVFSQSEICAGRDYFFTKNLEMFKEIT